MARSHELIYSLNAGGVDPNALSRIDLERMRLAGEHPVANWLPTGLGPMTLRPGLEHLADVSDQTRSFAFQRSVDTKYLLRMSANEMRIVSDGSVVQIPTHSTTIGTGSWTDESSGSATATGGATLSFTATATNSAKLRQSVTVGGGDQATVHILRIVVSQGPLVLRVGTSAGGQELIEDTILYTGTHKIAFTPGTSPVYVELRSDDPVARSVSQIDFEANLTSGDLILPTPWSWAQVVRLRTWQSIDVMFIGDGANQQRRIENRDLSPYSWSVALYESYNGPYSLAGGNITITPDGLTGNVTLTASENYFQSGHAGALIELTQTGKTVSQTLDGADQSTDYVTVTGIDAERILYRTATESSFIGTLTLQRSVQVDEPISWNDVTSWTDSGANFGRTAYDDNQDNLTAHYRLTIKAGEYTSGSVDVVLEYDNQTQTGQALITGYTSGTEVDAEVRVPFGATTATRSWRIGSWSDVSGWPRVPVIHDDRLHWFDDDGRDYASEVDDYVDFDDTIEGDSAPFVRTVQGGKLEGVQWAKSEERLLVGTIGFEATIQANEFDGALTRTDFTSRKFSRRGCSDVNAATHHSGIFYAQRSGKRLYEASIGPSQTRYRSQNISRLNPGACSPGIKRIAVQEQPETRAYAVLDDGSLIVLTYEPEDEVIAFTTITTPNGTFDDVEVLVGTDQDEVYVDVTVSGSRYLWRFAGELDQESVSTCALLDGWEELTGSISTISGATRFASETVQIWADGQRRGDVTLDGSGNGTLDGTYSRVIYGKNYDASFKSAKLAYAAQLGTSVSQEKIIRHMALILSNSCLAGLTFGTDENSLEPMPDIIEGVERTAGQFFSHLDIEPVPVASEFDTDARVFVKTKSQEGPCTVQALVFDVETPEMVSPPSQ